MYHNKIIRRAVKSDVETRGRVIPELRIESDQSVAADWLFETFVQVLTPERRRLWDLVGMGVGLM